MSKCLFAYVNNSKKFDENLEYERIDIPMNDSGKFCFQKEFDKDSYLFFSESDVITKDNHYGLSTSKQSPINENQEFKIQINGHPLKLEKGYFFITIDIEQKSLSVSNHTRLKNSLDYDTFLMAHFYGKLYEQIKTTVKPNNIWNNIDYRFFGLFFDIHYESVHESPIDEFFKDFTPLFKVSNEDDFNKYKKRKIYNVSIVKRLIKGNSKQVLQKLEHCNSSIPRSIYKFISGKKKSINYFEYGVFCIWYSFEIELLNDHYKFTHDSLLLVKDVFLQEASDVKSILPQNDISSTNVFPVIYDILCCFTEKLSKGLRFSQHTKSRLIFLLLNSPLIPHDKKMEILVSIRETSLSDNVQKDYNRFLRLFPIANERLQFTYNKSIKTKLTEQDLECEYSGNACNFILNLKQIDILYDKLKEGGYIDANTDIKNLSCALTGKNKFGFTFRRIYWTKDQSSLAILIGILKDYCEPHHKRFQWKNISELFFAGNTDIHGANLNIQYTRYKKRPPKKRKEIESIIKEVLSFNGTEDEDKEEN